MVLTTSVEGPFDYNEEIHQNMMELHANKGLHNSKQLMLIQALIDYRRVRDHFLR